MRFESAFLKPFHSKTLTDLVLSLQVEEEVDEESPTWRPPGCRLGELGLDFYPALKILLIITVGNVSVECLQK